MSDLYQEIILEHAQHPHHFGELSNPTHKAKDANASCGDMAEFQFVIRDGKIVEVAWRGVGCAISTASASILTDLVVGKTLKEAQAISEKELLGAMGIDAILPTREKCVILPLKILQKLA